MAYDYERLEDSVEYAAVDEPEKQGALILHYSIDEQAPQGVSERMAQVCQKLSGYIEIAQTLDSRYADLAVQFHPLGKDNPKLVVTGRSGPLFCILEELMKKAGAGGESKGTKWVKFVGAGFTRSDKWIERLRMKNSAPAKALS